MNTDNIAVTQQEEEEFSAMSKVEPKNGEWWLCDVKKDGRQALYLGANGWIYSKSSDDIIDNASPISRLYTQEEYDNKPVSPVDDSEWKNGIPPVGAECVYRHKNQPHNPWLYQFDGVLCDCVAHVGDLSVLVAKDLSFSTACNDLWIEKPESKEDKEARERMESAYDLYASWVGDAVGALPFNFTEFSSDGAIVRKWLRVLDKTGYRK